jgi:hypothetical protein
MTEKAISHKFLFIDRFDDKMQMRLEYKIHLSIQLMSWITLKKGIHYYQNFYVMQCNQNEYLKREKKISSHSQNLFEWIKNLCFSESLIRKKV